MGSGWESLFNIEELGSLLNHEIAKDQMLILVLHQKESFFWQSSYGIHIDINAVSFLTFFQFYSPENHLPFSKEIGSAWLTQIKFLHAQEKKDS